MKTQFRQALGEIRKSKEISPAEFGRRMAMQHTKNTAYKHSPIKHGDFNVTQLGGGNRYLVVCRKCNIKGEIFLVDSEPRSRCPRCSKLGSGDFNPYEAWRLAGYAGLVPEMKPKRSVLGNIAPDFDNSFDDEEETDDAAELVMPVSCITTPAAGEDDPNYTLESEHDWESEGGSTESAEDEPAGESLAHQLLRKKLAAESEEAGDE